MRRVITAIAAVAALAALGAAPAYAGRAQPRAHPAPQVQVLSRGFHAVRLPSGLKREILPRLQKGKVVKSGNWSGYATLPKHGHKFKAVSANFTVPSVDCAASTAGTGGFSSMSNWVGLDGFTDLTVEQTGEFALCDGTTLEDYYVFWENYPNPANYFCCANPGDAIHVSVTYSSKTHLYHLYLIDYSLPRSKASNNPLNEFVACATKAVCKNSSAEVIGEDLDGGPPDTDLADFGQTSFVNSTVTSSNGKSGTLTSSRYWTSVEIIMKPRKLPLMAKPSSLEGGRAFYDTYYAPQ